MLMKHHFGLALVATFAVVGSVFADPPKSFTAKVVGITDGDTITVLLDKQQHKIRLAGIDAPESRQAFGTKAKQVLSEKIFGKEVKVVWSSRDKWRRRILGHIYLDDRWINKELVEEGFAWRYKYSRNKDLATAQNDAKRGNKGLWADPSPIPPWDFRNKKSRIYAKWP